MKSPLSLDELLSALAPGSRILDLGCGGGTFRYAEHPSLVIHALDEAAHEKIGSFPPHAHFVCAAASAIPERDAVFDLVVVNFAFEHFPDPVAALGEIARVSKDRAYVWISMPNAGSFEDQLYRNLFAGGGHLQSPTLERFLRLVYENTCLKLVSYCELPAGFTFLGESEELRHLTWAIIDALRRSVAIEAQAQSGYIFVLQKDGEAGPGFREFSRTCHACGGPDETELPSSADTPSAWVCRKCGANNPSPATLQCIDLDKISRAQRLQWQRLPDTHPARLRELIEERNKWALELERELGSIRKHAAELAEECDRRGRWGLELQREIESTRKHAAELAEECDRRGRWGLELQREIESQRARSAALQAEHDRALKDLLSEVSELKRPIGYLKHAWKRMARLGTKRQAAP